MNKLLTAAILTFGILMTPDVQAHGDAKPKHGGVVAVAGDLGFELVSTADGVSVYVDDHGKPLSTAGMSGKLTVLNGADKSETVLTVAEGNRLDAAGVKLAEGAKVVATLTTAAKKTLPMRFTVKVLAAAPVKR